MNKSNRFSILAILIVFAFVLTMPVTAQENVLPDPESPAEETAVTDEPPIGEEEEIETQEVNTNEQNGDDQNFITGVGVGATFGFLVGAIFGWLFKDKIL